ncbi:MAG: hypothetical protein WD052_03770 [Bacteroidales bacterium]
MSKIIYIAGLGHSGSTILDMSLGTIPGVVGVGELKTLMDDHSRNKHYTSVCSCGKPATECVVWEKVPEIMQGKENDPEKIEAFLAHLKYISGESVTMVDSSKNSYQYLRYLHENHDLKMIFLTRDVRSWSYSRYLSTGKPILYFLVRWYLENLKLKVRIRKMGIPFLKVGYEELSLYPEHLMKKITRYAAIPYDPSVLTPGNTGSHIISGNVARTDQQKRAAWLYDSRWMLSWRMMLLSPIVTFLHGKNKKYVYSNIMTGSMKDFHLYGTRRKEALSKTHN